MEGINLANITKATRTFVLSPTKLTFDQLSKAERASIVDIIERLEIILTSEDGITNALIDGMEMKEGLRAFYEDTSSINESEASLQGRYDELQPRHARLKARAAQEAHKAILTDFLMDDLQLSQAEAFADGFAKSLSMTATQVGKDRETEQEGMLERSLQLE